MISILISTYNYDIINLVAALHHQALETYVDFEIIVIEDGSTLYVDKNARIKDFEFCRHIILPENIGRSAIRNKLANEAKYEHLLFIDCDAEICSEYFVAKYLSFCKEECIVIGGTAYDPNENNPRFSLRLAYGRQREARTAIERSKREQNHQKKLLPRFPSPKREGLGVRYNFATFNFLISKSIFNQVYFDESIRGYGHEDMIFGHQLRQLSYKFIQIENPLIHKGLDDNEAFLCKTKEATLNLLSLYQTGHYPYLPKESKLLNSFVRINKLGLKCLCATAFDQLQPALERKLCSASPSLRLYDLYKLLFMCKSSLSK